LLEIGCEYPKLNMYPDPGFCLIVFLVVTVVKNLPSMLRQHWLGYRKGIRRAKCLALSSPLRLFFGRPSGNPASPGMISGKIGQLNNKKLS